MPADFQCVNLCGRPHCLSIAEAPSEATFSVREEFASKYGFHLANRNLFFLSIAARKFLYDICITIHVLQ